MYCIICSKTIGIAYGGSSVLHFHKKGKIHSELAMKRNENKIVNLFKKKSADSTATTANEVQVISTCARPPFVVSEDVLDVKIIWFLRLVHSHQNYQSRNRLPTFFQRRFKTCPVAQQFHMKNDKARYMIVYGLYSALKAKQQTKINTSPWFEPSSTKMPNGC